jgi:hypothetical protein
MDFVRYGTNPPSTRWVPIKTPSVNLPRLGLRAGALFLRAVAMVTSASPAVCHPSSVHFSGGAIPGGDPATAIAKVSQRPVITSTDMGNERDDLLEGKAAGMGITPVRGTDF